MQKRFKFHLEGIREGEVRGELAGPLKFYNHIAYISALHAVEQLDHYCDETDPLHSKKRKKNIQNMNMLGTSVLLLYSFWMNLKYDSHLDVLCSTYERYNWPVPNFYSDIQSSLEDERFSSETLAVSNLLKGNIDATLISFLFV